MAVLGQHGVVQGKDYRGVDVISALVPIPDSPWTIVSKMDTTEAFAAWRSRAKLDFGAALGSLCPGWSHRFTWPGSGIRSSIFRPCMRRRRVRRASLARHRVILNSIGDGVIVTDALGLVEMLNPVAEALTGWYGQAAIGRPLPEIFQIVDEVMHQPVENPVLRVLEEGAIVGLANHTLLIARDSTERPIADSSAPIRDEHGNITGVVLVFRDQTEERAARRALEQSEERNRAMISAVPDTLFRLDGDGRFLDCQVSDGHLLLMPPDQFIGKTVPEVLPLQVANEATKAIAQAIETGELQLFEYGLETPEGHRWYEERIARISSGEVLAVTRDISARHRSEIFAQTRVQLMEFAVDHSLAELLQETLDRVCELVKSPVGFYHFVEADQHTVLLQAWSSRTLAEFCTAAGGGHHYSLDTAGVWADCVRVKKPIIHNDYANLPDRKGMPDGHAELVRELVTPILRQDRVVAVLGVGNKPVDYNQQDLELVTYLADVAWEIVERKRAEEKYQTLFQEMPYGFAVHEIILDEQGIPVDYRFLAVNPTFERMTHLSAEAVVEKTVLEVMPKTEPHWIDIYGRVALTGEPMYFEEYAQETGRYWEVAAYRPAPNQFACFFADITERKRAEEEQVRLQEQLVQAQKMETVGRLAGGVAHDFNNMLAVILMRSEVALQQLDAPEALQRHLVEIRRTAQRSADLTRQLLGFARKQTIEPRVLDLNAAVEGTFAMLQRLIGEDVDLLWKPRAHLWPIKMDPSQVDQILANLCVNARDAIFSVGKIIIETENVVLDRVYSKHHPTIPAGEYVMLAVSDNGSGMDKEVLAHIFEPFYTTKQVGKGTGLGSGYRLRHCRTEPGSCTGLQRARHRHDIQDLSAPLQRRSG